MTRAGRTLNDAAAFLKKNGIRGEEVEEAVRLLNAVAYQYHLIPRDIREEYFREELVPDGVRLHDVSEK